MDFKKMIVLCATAILCCLILISPNFIKKDPLPDASRDNFSVIRLSDYDVVVFDKSRNEIYKVQLYRNEVGEKIKLE